MKKPPLLNFGSITPLPHTRKVQKQHGLRNTGLYHTELYALQGLVTLETQK